MLTPCGITDMQIAGNTLKQRAPNEAMYLGQFGENPYNMNVTRMDSHGGWIANPSDLARFCAHVGGMPGIPSILKPETIADHDDARARLSAIFAGEVCARLDGARQRQRQLVAGGSLPGTTSIMVRTANGMCWGALTNTRTQPSDTINTAIDKMVWDMVNKVPAGTVNRNDEEYSHD